MRRRFARIEFLTSPRILGGFDFYVTLTYGMFHYSWATVKDDERMDHKSDESLLKIMGLAHIAVEWVDCKTGIFLDVNDYAGVIHERAPEEIIGQYIWDLAPLLDRQKFKELVDYLRVNKKSTLEIIHYNNSDKIFPVEITMIYREETDDMPEHFVTFVKDITKRKKAEEELIQSNAELEEFAYRVSHDLRAPLVSSIRLTELASDCMKEGQISVADQSLTHIRNSLTKLESLLCNILTLTRTKHEEEQPQNVLIDELVDHSLDNIMHMENFQKLDIVKDIQDDCEIYLKKSRLVLIVENLISNAVKYQNPNEDNPFVKITSYRSNNDFIFEVADNGLGIPEDQQNNMFKMFKRFHPKTSFGSGLGLYMIKKSADILEGHIEYISKPKGGKFRLTLPYSPPKRSDYPAAKLGTDIRQSI